VYNLSAIGNHLRQRLKGEQHDIESNFWILRKCESKLDLIYEMLFIKDKKPKLTKQSDLIWAKLFL